MSVTFTDPSALWLLLVVPLVWLGPLAARTTFNQRQRLLQASVRSLLLAAIALALARPVVATTSSRESLVYLVDVSHSVASRAIEDAARQIDELDAALQPAHSRIVAFGRDAVVLEGSDELRRFAAPSVPGERNGSSGNARAENAESVDRTGTDLEAALDVARAELVPGFVPRVMLFSDGDVTAGDSSAAVARFAADEIPIAVAPLPVRSIGDVWVEAIGVPDRLAAGESFTATVRIGAQRAAPASVELRADGQLLAEQAVAVPIGGIEVALDATVPSPGVHVLRAVVSAPEDPLAVNDALDVGIWTDAQARVLYVEGVQTSAGYLSRALTDAGFLVDVQPPGSLPSAAEAFDVWDAVILSDVPSTALPDGAMPALAQWVEQRGGGLLIAGGESVFGAGGYRETPLERIAPVTFERRDEPQVALVLVLDRSWSMSGQAMDLCKAAAQAAVDVMTDEQFVGVLTFNDQLNWDVPLRNVGLNRDQIRDRIGAIEAGGHTLIYPAVEQAYLALRTAKARAKHVILLSDGRSYPDDYEGLVTKMSEANITVSSVAVGPAADNELLEDIATWGKGRSYLALNPRDVPQIFVKEARNAMTPGFDEEGITPIVESPAFLTGVDVDRLPRLRGRTATVLKEDALQVIASDNDDPLLAFWPVGLGRTAVFASDVKDRWAADWVTWPGYGPFFSSVVRAVQRRESPAVRLEVTPGPARGRARSMEIALEARGADGGYGNLLRPTVQVQEEGGASAAVPLRQVAPGRYQASVMTDAGRTVLVRTEGAGVTGRLVVPDPSAEYRFGPLNERLLRSIALATGGAWQPTPQALANQAGDRRTERRPLWPGLLIFALGCWFADIVLRRVRVFERR
jgi:uncharacterized membrane protein